MQWGCTMYDNRAVGPMHFKAFFVFALAVSLASAAPLSEYQGTLSEFQTPEPTPQLNASVGVQAGVSPTPTNTPAPTSTPGGGGGGGGGGTTPTPAATAASTATPVPAATATPVPAATPTPTPVPVVVFETPVPVVEEKAKGEIADVVKQELKIEDVKNVDVSKVAEVVVKEEMSAARVEQALQAVTETKAKEALTEIRNSIVSGSSSSSAIEKKVEVFEVKEKTTGETKKVSKITLEFKPGKDVKDVKIVEVIPKSVAASIIDVLFTGEKPEVLQADPVVQWKFNEVKAGESKDLSYVVKKEVTKVEMQTVASVAAEPTPTAIPKPAEEKPADMTSVYIIVLVIIIAIYSNPQLRWRIKKIFFGKSRGKYEYKP